MNIKVLQVALQPLSLVSRFYHYEKTDSTMDQARRLIKDSGPGIHHGTLVIADFQEAGRGRHGREWQAESGQGLLVSLVLDRELLPQTDDSAQLPLVACAIPVAICKALQRFVQGVRIKYPNDIVVEGRKLGGVLLETCGSYVVAGFGINCHQELSHLPASLRMPASSIFMETGQRVERERVLVAVLEELQTVLAPDDFATVGFQMNDLCDTLGRAICVDTGSKVLTGTALEIDAAGTLKLQTAEGIKALYSSNVVRTWSLDAPTDQSAACS